MNSVKIWLVVMSMWGTPATIKQMPGMASCQAVAKAISEMHGGAVRCAAARRDWN